jgi:X-Pro dipeptidyl-peptidase
MTRPGRVLSALALATSSLFAALPASAPAAPGIEIRDGVTQPVFSYEQAVRETVYVQSSVDEDADGQPDLIATDIIRPKETEHGLDVPVIYEQSPYYQASGRGNESEIKSEEDGDFIPATFPLFYDNYFVPRGYAFIAQDMPGTRNSEGCMVLGGPAEALAAKATIDWLNGRGEAFTGLGEPVKADWSTGKVAMIGKSYDASVANGAAALGIDGLETIVPIGGIDRWYDYHLNNGVQYLNAYTTPALFVFDIDQQPGDDEERGQAWVEATFGENTVCSEKGTEIVARAADPQADYNQFWDDRDYLKDVDRTKASVFVVHGLNDWNVKPNNWVQWWNGLSKQNVDRKLWLAQTGHVDPFDFRRERWVGTLHRWFDFWLQGIDNGIMSEPMVDIERKADRWKTYAGWPAAGARSIELWFGPKKGDSPGTLSLKRAPAGEIQSYTDDASDQSESSMVSSPTETKSTRLLFLTPKLTRNVRLSGTPEVDITASVNSVDTNFTALLVDYGSAVRVDHEGSGEGIRTTQKESCYGGKTELDNGCYFMTEKLTHKSDIEIVSRGWLDARHRDDLRAGSPLEPGTSYRFRWEIFGEDYVFKPGHQIGVVIAGSDADWTIPDPENASVDVDLHASRVLLPLVGGASKLPL